MARKPTEIVNFTLRLREDLRKRLERAADKAERSLNIEIVERLEASFAADDKARDQKQMMAKLDEIEDRVTEQIAKINYAEWFQEFMRRAKEGK
jgi:hypothetical protein